MVSTSSVLEIANQLSKFAAVRLLSRVRIDVHQVAAFIHVGLLAWIVGVNRASLLLVTVSCGSEFESAVSVASLPDSESDDGF
jgi:hypothetical protein